MNERKLNELGQLKDQEKEE